MKKSTIIGTTLAAIAGIILLALLAIVLSSPTEVKEIKVNTKEVTKEATIEEEARVEFIAACNEDGGLYTFCACTYDYLYYNFGLGAIVEMGVEYDNTGILNDQATEAITYCLN